MYKIRKFDKKNWFKSHSQKITNKSRAIRHKSNMKKKGFKVRMVKTKKGYEIYTNRRY